MEVKRFEALVKVLEGYLTGATLSKKQARILRAITLPVIVAAG